MLTDTLHNALERAIVSLEDAYDLLHGQRSQLSYETLTDMARLSEAIRLVQAVKITGSSL
jgi:hypothetical protein